MDDSSDIPQYIPGDLLWAKIGSHPFWPCMVGYDPIKGNYSRLCKSGSKEYYIYHVQFFGDKAQRGWTTRNILPYEGIDKFYDKFTVNSKSKENLPQNEKRGPEILKNGNRIKPCLLKSWNTAVEECEEALEVKDKTERFKTYVFNYDILKKKQPKGNQQIVPNGNNQSVTENGNSNKHEGQKPKKLKQANDVENNIRICYLCTKSNADLSCDNCCKEFHSDCIGLVSATSFLCSDCATGFRACFYCGEFSDTVVKCRHAKCSKYYHPECFKKMPCGNGKNYHCSLHSCLTCYAEDPRNSSARKGNLVTCFRCPSAFHALKSCIPAGCVDLKPNVSILCPFHFVLNAKKSKVINVNNCIICGEGGDLICCDACPMAYHKDCLDDDNVPEGAFLCEYCQKKNHFYYSMVVWCKLGNHSWWPSKIVDPSELPPNIQKLSHDDGEFPVKFFGTHNYCWTSRGRVIAYEEHHKKYKTASSGKNKQEYKTALIEAQEEYDKWKAHRQSVSPCSVVPPAYKAIKVNRYSEELKNCSNKGDVTECTCSSTCENPCGTTDCINRAMLVECDPKNCKAGDKCENQRFQKRQYKATKIFKTNARGWGLKATAGISKGEFVLEYVGEIITTEEYRKRSGELQQQNSADFYFLYLDNQRIIDARPMGNYARFINHSCDPNCIMEKWQVLNDVRVGIFALKDISPGEELTFDYQSEEYDILQDCFCNSANCRGIIGKNQNQ